MSWYAVDKEIETTFPHQGCQRALKTDKRRRGGWKYCGKPAVRTLRVTTDVQGERVVVGSYGLCDPCADVVRSGNATAFGYSLKGGAYAR